jgi:hypothetical protein
MKLVAPLIAALCIAAPALAKNAPVKKPPTTGPSTAPATRPSAEVQQRIDQLITQLGDPKYAVRDAATEELKKLGAVALSQLRDAVKNPDPEIAARAEYVLRDIEEQTNPKAASADDPTAGPIPWRQGAQIQGGGIVVRLGGIHVAGQGARQVVINENGKQIRIVEDPQGITVTITEEKDGKPVTQEYKAKNADELKKNHPEIHKIYEKHAPKGGAAQQQIKVKIIGQ